MRPGMNTDLVASHVLRTEDSRSFNDSGANNKEGCVEVFFVQVSEKSSEMGWVSDREPLHSLLSRTGLVHNVSNDKRKITRTYYRGKGHRRS